MSNISTHFEASNPFVHGLHAPLSERIGSLCNVYGLKPTDAYFNFLEGTVLTPYALDDRRVRPLILGDLSQLISYEPASDLPTLQVDLHASETEVPTTVTYIVPSEFPMTILTGETIGAEGWQDLERLAVTDLELFLSLRDLLPNILFELSDSHISPPEGNTPAQNITLEKMGQPLLRVFTE